MAVAAVRLRPRQWLPAGRPCAVRAPSATPRAGSRGPTAVFPRLEGVGPTFDARVSTRCLRKTLGVCAKAQDARGRRRGPRGVVHSLSLDDAVDAAQCHKLIWNDRPRARAG